MCIGQRDEALEETQRLDRRGFLRHGRHAYARSRDTCAINVVATQSYAVLVSRFKDQHAARALIANLRNQGGLGMNGTVSLARPAGCATKSAVSGSPTAEASGRTRVVVVDWKAG